MASYRYERDIPPEDLIQHPPRSLTAREKWANWWHYHWRYTAILLLTITAAGYILWQNLTAIEPDHTVTVISRRPLEQEALDSLAGKLTTLAQDENGDGQVKVEVKNIWLDLRTETQDSAQRQLRESNLEKLNADFYLCQSAVFLVDDPQALEQMYGCFRLLDGSDPKAGQMVRVKDFALPAEDTVLCEILNQGGWKNDSQNETQRWYLARRAVLTEKNASQLASGDNLWNALMEARGQSFS